MLNREDRRDLGCLGLLVAVYGLACAPVLHAVYGHGGAPLPSAVQARANEPPDLPAPHDESQPHSHDPAGHTHGAGSVEHLQAVALPSAVPPPLLVAWVESGTRHLGEERPRLGEPPRPTAMPQAP